MPHYGEHHTMNTSLEHYRNFLKDSIRQTIDFWQTDQNQGIAPPPLEKPFSPDAIRIDLPQPVAWQQIPSIDLFAAIRHRRSHRKFTQDSLSIEELSFLLWTTQGMKEELRPERALRTVPSAGCRHALETYLCVLNVEGLDVGIYRYLPIEHQLLFELHVEQLAQKIVDATLGQKFTGKAAVTFLWTTIPYRMEWRYAEAAHKVIALDAGHVCQNLYLACEAIGAGSCAIAAYHQELADKLLKLDEQDEFTVYLSAVGKV